MKKFLILAVAAISMFNLSCKRNIDEIEVIEPRDLTITIQSATATRAEAATNEESKINGGWCLVFRGSDDAATLDCAPYMLKTNGATNSFRVTTQAQTVFVVANADGLDVNSIRSIGDLKAKTTDLFKNDEQTQKSTNLTMWGQSLITKGSPVYSANVTMRFAPAKVNFTYSLESSQVGLLENPEVVVINAQGLSRLIPNFSSFEPSKADGAASLMPETVKYYSAINDFGNGEVKEALKISNAAANEIATFYLFENTSAESTIIAVRGMYAGKMTYFPIHFTQNDKGNVAFEPIVAGKIFNVNAKINHLSGGTTDPTVPVTQTAIEVTVTPASWYTSITWEKEFN